MILLQAEQGSVEGQGILVGFFNPFFFPKLLGNLPFSMRRSRFFPVDLSHLPEPICIEDNTQSPDSDPDSANSFARTGPHPEPVPPGDSIRGHRVVGSPAWGRGSVQPESSLQKALLWHPFDPVEELRGSG